MYTNVHASFMHKYTLCTLKKHLRIVFFYTFAAETKNYMSYEISSSIN